MKHYKRWIIAGAALTAAVVLLLCVAGVFRVREVTVTGNEYYTKEQIADFVIGDGLKRNTLYLYVRYNYMEHPEIPFIDAFEVKVDSPSSLTIRVYEKNIVGMFTIWEKMSILTRMVSWWKARIRRSKVFR